MEQKYKESEKNLKELLEKEKKNLKKLLGK